MTAANQLSFETVSQTGRSLDPPFVLLDSVQWSYYGETGEWLTTEANFKQTHSISGYATFRVFQE
jgi:hypothetical protein